MLEILTPAHLPILPHPLFFCVNVMHGKPHQRPVPAGVDVAGAAALLRVPARAQHRRDLHRRAQERDGKVILKVKGDGQGTGLFSKILRDKMNCLAGNCFIIATSVQATLPKGSHKKTVSQTYSTVHFVS